MRALLVLTETQGWQAGSDSTSDDLADIKAALKYIVQVSREPLESKGASIASIQDELEEAVEYARQYLAIAIESYKAIWYKFYISSNAEKWPNLLLLCELIFNLPFTASRVEQMFSMLKTIREKHRTTSTLCDLIELNIEGSSLSEFSAEECHFQPSKNPNLQVPALTQCSLLHLLVNHVLCYVTNVGSDLPYVWCNTPSTTGPRLNNLVWKCSSLPSLSHIVLH